MKVHPEMLLKTKDRENEQAPATAIPGSSVAILPQGAILAPDSFLLSPRFQEMKVQPEICMKTKDRENGEAPTTADTGSAVATLPQSGILAPDFFLLTPALQEMKVQPEMLLKTKTE